MAAKAEKRALRQQIVRTRDEVVTPTRAGFSVSMGFVVRGMRAFELERYLDELNADANDRKKVSVSF
jgi:hypothetical protein